MRKNKPDQTKIDITKLVHGKVPPQDKEVEKAVLGAILLEKTAFALANNSLHEDVFYVDVHRRIWKAMLALFDKIENIDILTVSSQLEKNGDLDSVGGRFYVTTLTNDVVSSAHLEDHCRHLLELYLKRRQIEIAGTMIQEGYDNTVDVFDSYGKADNALISAQESVLKGVVKDMSHYAMKVYEEYETVKSTGVLGMQTGIFMWDRLLSGLVAPDLVILAARPGAGKSACAISITKNLSVDKDIPGAWFSLEMSGVQITRRLVSIVSGINHEYIRKGQIPPHQETLFMEATDKVSRAKIHIEDNANMNIRELRTRAVVLKRRYDIQYIVVDYLQLMGGVDTFGKSRENIVSEISRGLKVLAKEINVPILALSQLSRQVESRADKMPQLSDLRESGCLTADTKIYCPSHKKWVNIEDLVGVNDFTVLSYHNGRNIELKAKKAFPSGVKQTYEMKLLNGLTIKATANHKFLTPEGWMPLADLDGKTIALPIGYETKVIHEISEQECRLVAHFIANGSCVKNQPIRYCCNINDGDLAQLVMDDATVAAENEISPVKKDTILDRSKFSTVFFKSNFNVSKRRRSPISEILRKYKLYDVRAKQKKIPDEFYFLSDKNTCEFLSALFSGDGTVFLYENKGRQGLKISYSSASKELILGVQTLLMKVGAVSFISELHKGPHTWYNLYISGKSNIEVFVKKVGFKSKRKNDIMVDAWEKVKGNLAGWTKYEFNENRTLCYMPVKSIEPAAIENVYDIEVPEAHNFVANNMTVHNSIEQDADSVIFLMRPEYYGFMESILIGEKEYEPRGLCLGIAAKNRHGATQNFAMWFDGPTMRIGTHVQDAYTLPSLPPEQIKLPDNSQNSYRSQDLGYDDTPF